MSDEGLAGWFFHALIRIVLKLLNDGKNAGLVDRWGAVAEHVNNPAPNVWIGVVSHFQESIPNLWIVTLNFTRAQSLNGLAPHSVIVVSAQFEQARDF
jgi:hypothetical protein